MSAEQDAADVRRVLGGNVEAFAGIVQRWQGPMIQLAYRFCQDRALAEDMAQDAFLQVYRSLAQWRGKGQFSTWLFAVATNVHRSRLRKKRLPKVPLEAVAQFAAQRLEEDALEERERARLVRAAVGGLPAKYRDAVTLYYFHEMDVRQAALSLGLSEGTVKSQLHRARRLLQRSLGDLLGASRSAEEAA